jgi:predicted alpha/beta hydrolase
MQIRTSAGHEISAELFAPGGEPRGAVLIVPAMGVTQAFYRALASWLAGQGFLTATFDYRGMGQSRHGRLRDVDATVVDWAVVDCAAMVDAMAARAPGKPLTWLGHSLGGQLLGLVPNRARIVKAVSIAAGSGYWRDNSPGLRWRVWVLWWLLVPLTVPLFGYFPGKRLRLVGDVPGPAMRQWRRWCLDPDYVVGAEGEAMRARYAAVDTPIHSLSFTDDEFMSARSIDALMAFYTGAPRTSTRLHPRDAGESRIGHFGFFRPRYEQSLWRPHLLPQLANTPVQG